MSIAGFRCLRCGRFYLSRRENCPACGGDQFEEVQMPGRGKIVSYTTIRVPPSRFKAQAPYTVALIELDNGVRLTARVEGGEVGLGIGQPAEIVRQENGNYLFRPQT